MYRSLPHVLHMGLTHFLSKLSLLPGHHRGYKKKLRALLPIYEVLITKSDASAIDIDDYDEAFGQHVPLRRSTPIPSSCASSDSYSDGEIEEVPEETKLHDPLLGKR